MKTLTSSLVLATLSFAGCPWMDPDLDLPPDGSESGLGEDTTPATYSIAGTVTRLSTAPIAPGNDGVGTLYIGVFPQCAHGVPPIGSAAIINADLSDLSKRVPFAIDMLPGGTVYLASFLDDNLNAELPAPEPDEGDPSLADDVDDGILTCVAVEIPESDVDGVEFALNITH